MKILERKLEICDSRAKLYDRAAKLFVKKVTQFAATPFYGLIALSGGSTPKGLYELLARPKYSKQIPWNKLCFLFGDERCVPPDDSESNYKMAYDTLLSKVPVRESNIFRFKTELAPKLAAKNYEDMINAYFGPDSRIGLVLLGMGADGHTASLFPGSPALNLKTKKTAAVYAQHLAAWRLTMTLPVFNSAREVIFLVAGKEKAEAVRKVFSDSASKLPARMVRSGKETDVLWLVDKDAASLLSEKTIEKFSQKQGK
jgi:6-phosphogluconolactonase